MLDEMKDEEARPKSSIKSDESYATLHLLREKLGFENGALASTKWTGGLNESELSQLNAARVKTESNGMDVDDGITSPSSFDQMKAENTQRGYRLAFSDGKYRDYINEYAINDFAKSTQQRTKERDKKRYLNIRFSLTEESEFAVRVQILLTLVVDCNF